MKSTFAFCMLLWFCLPNCKDSVVSGDGESKPDVVRPLTASEKSLVRSSNQFGFRLLKAVNESEAGGDVFISPFSVSMALGMVLNGANGSTGEAVQSTLGFSSMTREEINKIYFALIHLLRNLDPRVQFDIANSIWHRLGFTVETEFLETNKKYFEAIVTGLNFGAPDAAKTINEWVDVSTKGKIREIVPDPIADEVMMYLINAIYFKGTWMYQFDKTRTMDAPFYRSDGVIRTTQMMHMRGTLVYVETPSYQVIELPYGDSLFSMIVVLPKPGHSIDAFVEKLTDDSWGTLKDGLDPQLVTLYLPKFTLEYEKGLVEVLTALGMGVAFDGELADFTGINRNGELYISDVKHKTFVQVDEEGTEAAAVTSVEIRVTSLPAEVVMRVDRPFFFVITERHSGTLLFMGKVMEPSA